MTRPTFVRRSITSDQLALLARLLRLSAPTTTAVRLVLMSGETHAAAGNAAGIAPPQVSRAISRVRDLDAAIRAVYPARQRVREAADSPA